MERHRVQQQEKRGHGAAPRQVQCTARQAASHSDGDGAIF
ncbi:hypothetical protein PF003_g21898 [Phytophthora fragariae]|nr:hypothetical protein PF003_g21898 [Phytophthora fragariae]